MPRNGAEIISQSTLNTADMPLPIILNIIRNAGKKIERMPITIPAAMKIRITQAHQGNLLKKLINHKINLSHKVSGVVISGGVDGLIISCGEEMQAITVLTLPLVRVTFIMSKSRFAVSWKKYAFVSSCFSVVAPNILLY